MGLEPPEEFIHRHPYELSGGQRQRVAIARALAVEPDVLVADEPTSMLDVSIRLDILKLFERLKREQHLAILLITHDLASARYLADRILVLFRGRVVEDGPTRGIVSAPAHPYTRALLAAIARRGGSAGAQGRSRRARHGRIGSGCPFASRCPDVFDVCRREDRTAALGIAGGALPPLSGRCRRPRTEPWPRRFPDGFLWGIATSALQIEGAVAADGRGESIWERFAATPGRIADGSTPRSPVITTIAGGKTSTPCASSGSARIGSRSRGRASYRAPRPMNEPGLDFYEPLVDALLAAGIQPFVTLNHWDLPQPLQDCGGWGARETVDAFVDYSEVVANGSAIVWRTG